jgi:hypothetical protein
MISLVLSAMNHLIKARYVNSFCGKPRIEISVLAAFWVVYADQLDGIRSRQCSKADPAEDSLRSLLTPSIATTS